MGEVKFSQKRSQFEFSGNLFNIRSTSKRLSDSSISDQSAVVKLQAADLLPICLATSWMQSAQHPVSASLKQAKTYQCVDAMVCVCCLLSGTENRSQLLELSFLDD